jgi:hypothetical protein
VGRDRPSLLGLGDLRSGEICSNWNLEWNLGAGFPVSGAHSCRRHGRIAVGRRRAHGIDAWNDDVLTEQAKRLMVWAGGARIKHPATSLSMQLLADGLKLGPAPPTRTGNGKAELRQLGGRGEVGDVAHGDNPPPQVPRHLMGGRKPNLGKHPVPLCPKPSAPRRRDRSPPNCCPPANDHLTAAMPTRASPRREAPDATTSPPPTHAGHLTPRRQCL